MGMAGLGQLPISDEFGDVEATPMLHHPTRALRESARDDVPVDAGDQRLRPLVQGVEVGRRMLAACGFG